MTTRGAERGMGGTVLLAVLILVVLATLLAATTLYFCSAQRVADGAALRAAQARALAWSGVQAVMADLADQRDELLRGASPRLTPEHTLIGGAGRTDGTGGSERGVFRAVAAGGRLVVAEGGRLDANRMPRDVLAKAECIGPAGADRLVAARGTRAFGSVVEAVALLEGGTWTASVGEVGEESGAAEEPGPDGSRASEAGAGGESEAGETGAGGVLTVFSFDPNVQVGAGGSLGRRRINLNQEWSEELAGAVQERFGKGAAEAVGALLQRGVQFKSDADIVKALRQLNLPQTEWPAVLDAFTTSPEEYLRGRIDLGTADAAVLACVPGISAEAAEKIVAARAGLSEEARTFVGWPLAESILTVEEFEQAVDFLTTRCTQWRVVVEGGFAGPDVGSGGEGRGAGGAGPEGPALRDRVVLEAVIDVAAERPRVAYLRDITLRSAAVSVESARQLAASFRGEDPARREEASPAGDAAGEARPAEAPAAGGPSDRASFMGPSALKGDARGMGDVSSAPGPAEAATETAPKPAAAAPPAVAKDRRIGRWTSGAGASK